MGFYWRKQRQLETREQMIAETSAFLSRALRSRQRMPRIPTRRVDRGGFSEMLKRNPLARLAVRHWWNRALSLIDS